MKALLMSSLLILASFGLSGCGSSPTERGLSGAAIGAGAGAAGGALLGAPGAGAAAGAAAGGVGGALTADDDD